MSIVSEILESAKKINVEDLNLKIPELEKNLNTLDTEIQDVVEKVHVKYLRRAVGKPYINILLEKSSKQQNILEKLKEKAEFIQNKDLKETATNLTNDIKKLSELDQVIGFLQKLIDLLQYLEQIDDLLDCSQYVSCLETMKKSEAIEKDMFKTVGDFKQNKLFKRLSLVICDKRRRFEDKLIAIVMDNFQIIQKPEQHVTVLRLKKLNDEMQGALSAYYAITNSLYTLDKIAEDLMNFIITLIISQTVVINMEEKGPFVLLVISQKDSDSKPNYANVFKNVELFVQTLSAHFNYNLNEDSSTLAYIGDKIGEEVSALIINDCLQHTIPSNDTEMAKYKETIDSTKTLEKLLLDSKIFNEGTTRITTYVENVDVLYIEKKCNEYLKVAIEIMKKDLHNIIQVGQPYTQEFSLDIHHLHFPQCSISKNVEELLKLTETILQKAVTTNSRIFISTVEDILLKYRTFVPEFHKTYLTTLPQQVAVFLNNCQYISFHVTQWNTKYCNEFKESFSYDFMTEANQFLSVGLQIFCEYIKGQSEQINEIMNEALLDGPTLEKLSPKTEKCVRQCLRQQELLRTVWHKVLSHKVYNKNMGIIVNLLCEKLITKITKFEDISAKGAEELGEVIKLVLTRAPKLFANAQEVTFYVSSWYKINELSFVLNAGLAEINDRWADGKGPLALYFGSNELKQLIKALFQNTDRRAAVISKISAFSVDIQ